MFTLFIKATFNFSSLPLSFLHTFSSREVTLRTDHENWEWGRKIRNWDSKNGFDLKEWIIFEAGMKDAVLCCQKKGKIWYLFYNSSVNAYNHWQELLQPWILKGWRKGKVNRRNSTSFLFSSFSILIPPHSPSLLSLLPPLILVPFYFLFNLGMFLRSS